MKKNNSIIKIIFLIAIFWVFVYSVTVNAETYKTEASKLERLQISQDSQEQLKDYYGELLGTLKTDAKFNTISTKDNIAIINVSLGNKSSRIFTRIYNGNILGQSVSTSGLINAKNIIATGNISASGFFINDIEKTFGPRRLFGIHSSNAKYIDEGAARLIDGKAKIYINPVLREQIGKYNVYLSSEGITNGIYISEKTDSYFAVKSLKPGSNVKFSWMVSGTKKEYEGEHLNPYNKKDGLSINAVIDYENGNSNITIYAENSSILNISKLRINENEKETKLFGFITANAILEDDLSGILNTGEVELPSLEQQEPQREETPNNGSDDNAVSNEPLQNNITNSTSDSTSENTNENSIDAVLNEPISSELNEGYNSTKPLRVSFVLSSVEDSEIIAEISLLTGLKTESVMKNIKFTYKEPENYGDETIGISGEISNAKMEGFEKVNGSVIIRLG